MERKVISTEIFGFNMNVDNSPDEYAFGCTVSDHRGIHRDVLFESCLDVLQYSCQKAKIVPNNVLQTRIFLQTPFLKKVHPSVHVDCEVEHLVCLFYMTDSDGPECDTKIYNNEMELISTVTPKRNRAVIFDGMLPHIAGYPTKTYRMVCNINFHRKGM